MSFVLLDDQIASHPKVLRAGAEAAWLWAVSIAYCSRQLTDGHVPADALSTLGKFKTPPVKLAARLVDAELFEVDGDGFRVIYDPDLTITPAQIEERRDRQRRHTYTDAERDCVRRRDNDCCRYCGEPVTWGVLTARGGTFDHIEPKGPPTRANLVVACRGCNSRKGHRTPVQAGMPLRELEAL